MRARRFLTALILLAVAGCAGEPASPDAAADVAGCYRGTGLRRAGVPASAPAARASSPAALVLDSVVEPGGKERHARVAQGARARAGYWEPERGDTLLVVVTDRYPPAVLTLRSSGRGLEGRGQLVQEMPGARVDTTSWPVRLASTACAPALAELPGTGTSRPPFPPALRTELVAMGDSDQAVRRGLTAESFADTALMHRMARGDSARTVRLEEILRKWGWPDGSRAGQSAAYSAFLVLQHSPSDAFQQRMLPVLDTLAQVGEVSGQDLALLTDRVLEHRGLPQRYGTQFGFEDGSLVLYSLEDSSRVDARRAAVGLMPLARYMELARRMYHAAAGPSMPAGGGGH